MFEIWDEEKREGETVGIMMEIVQAMVFLTRIPLRVPEGTSLPPLSQAARFFPLAGLVAGLIAGAAGAGAYQLGLGPLVSASIGIAAGIIATGALHEDGLADVADGFWGGRTLARKLAIMRDSRIGSYGVLALGLALLIRAGLGAEILVNQGGLALICGLMGATSLSRALIVPLMAKLPPAREDGLSAGAGEPSTRVMQQALALGGGLALAFFWAGSGFFAALTAIGLAVAGALGVALLARKHIGGQTGDVCGALSVVAETAAIAGLVMWL